MDVRKKNSGLEKTQTYMVASRRFFFQASRLNCGLAKDTQNFESRLYLHVHLDLIYGIFLSTVFILFIKLIQKVDYFICAFGFNYIVFLETIFFLVI